MPYGTVNADVIQSSVSGVSLGAGNASIMKNRIINGSMIIDQRNAGASVTPANGAVTYSVDRWAFYVNQASKLTAQQSSVAPSGFKNSLLVTSSSSYSVGSGDVFVLFHPIEGFNTYDLDFGTANAKTITVSFWVRSSLTGNFGGSIANSGNTRAYPFTFTINAANTFEYKTVTIPGDTSGTWVGATNGLGLNLKISLGAGSTFSGTAGAWASADLTQPTGATSVVGTNGATFYITGVQLEVGSSATGFEYRQYTTELQLCYRYYYKWINNTGGAKYGIILQAYSSTGAFGKLLDLPVTMRTTPTCLTSGTFNGLTGSGGSVTTAYTNTTIDAQTAQTLATGNWSGTSGLSAGNATVVQVSASAYIDASAEL